MKVYIHNPITISFENSSDNHENNNLPDPNNHNENINASNSIENRNNNNPNQPIYNLRPRNRLSTTRRNSILSKANKLKQRKIGDYKRFRNSMLNITLPLNLPAAEFAALLATNIHPRIKEMIQYDDTSTYEKFNQACEDWDFLLDGPFNEDHYRSILEREGWSYIQPILDLIAPFTTSYFFLTNQFISTLVDLPRLQN